MTTRLEDHSIGYRKRDGTYRFVELERIRVLYADKKYIEMRFELGGRVVTALLETSLKKLEERYPDFFLRIHRNCLVNLDYVVRAVVKSHNAEKNYSIKIADIEKPFAMSRRCKVENKDVILKAASDYALANPEYVDSDPDYKDSEPYGAE